MATSNQPIVYNYTGDGSTVVFPFSCYVLDAADIKVKLNGVLQSSGYTVNGVGNASGGDVTFDTAPATDDAVLIYRELTYDRPTDYQPSGPFPEEIVDNDQDRQTQQIQQLAEFDTRTMHLPIGTEGISLELPLPGSDEFLAYNEDGTALVTKPGTVFVPPFDDILTFTEEVVDSKVITNGTSSTITGFNPDATRIITLFNGLSVTGSNSFGLAIQLSNGSTLTTGFVGTTNGTSDPGNQIDTLSWNGTFDDLTGGSYIALSKLTLPAANLLTGKLIFERDISGGYWNVTGSINEQDSATSVLENYQIEGKIAFSGDLESIILTVSKAASISLDAGRFTAIQYYNKNATASIISPSNAAIAEYGNEGDFFVNTGTADALVLTIPTNSVYRTAYPPLVSGAYPDGIRGRFTVSTANTGAMTARFGTGPIVALKQGDGTTDIDANTFVPNHEYTIYTKDGIARYDVPASVVNADHSIALVKIVTGTPGTYLAYDEDGNLVEVTPPTGPFTEAEADGTGVNYTGAGQLYTWPHTLSDVPFGYLVEMECIAIDGGYPIGRRLLISSTADQGAGGGSKDGCSITSDDTNIYLKVGSSQFRGIAADGSIFQFAVNKWKFKAKAWL